MGKMHELFDGRQAHELDGERPRMTDIAATLQERESRYGSFQMQAKIAQDIKRAMRQGNWSRLADDQKECLEMLANKIGRILNGDPNYHDSWHDMVGYSKLVADRLLPNAREYAKATSADTDDAMRWRWLVRHASLGFEGAPSWHAVIRLPVFDSADQTITALVDSARKAVKSAATSEE